MPTSVSTQAWQGLNLLARELGFVGLAAAANHPVRCGERVRDWVREGMHGSMAWFANALDKRLDLNLVLEEAASVVALIAPYERESCSLAGKKLARYACGDDYHDVLKDRLWHLIGFLAERYPQAQFRPYVDTGPVLERYWAQEAGLGWIGKSGNLISRQYGSYIFISCIVTDLVVPYGQSHANYCGACRACVDACPTGAIVADGLVDSRKCISYLTIEHRGAFETPQPMDDWLYGCDICQEVCPWTTKFAIAPLLPAFAPRPAYSALSETELATMDQPRFSELFSKSPIKRTKLAGLKRNLAALQTGD